MNFTKFLIAALVGSIVYFLLGWLVYGILFTEIYPPSEKERLLFVFLGCLSFATLLSYVFNKWAGISSWMSGAKAGAILGFLIAVYMNLFMYSGMAEVNYQNMLLDIALGTVMGAITGAFVAMFSGKVATE